MVGMFSRTIMRPASLPMSLSDVTPLAGFDAGGARKISLKRGMTFSVKALLPDGINLTILKTF
jgi:hypothetical protein